MIKCVICGQRREGVITGDPRGTWTVEGGDHVHVPHAAIQQPDVETGFWAQRERQLSTAEVLEKRARERRGQDVTEIFVLSSAEPVRLERTREPMSWDDAHRSAREQLKQVAVPRKDVMSPEGLARAGEQALARLRAEALVFDEEELKKLTSELRRDLSGADLSRATGKAFSAAELPWAIVAGLGLFVAFALVVSGLALLL